jgi:hypothetical protein
LQDTKNDSSLKTKVPLPQRIEMATVPDQIANEPPLNNSTEQHSDSLTREPSQSNQNDFGSSEEKPNGASHLLFSDDKFWSIASIVGGFVVALALAVGHHTFLQYLDRRNIEDFRQEWIKAANNGFSNVFSIFVALSASSALTQIVRMHSCLYVCPVGLMIVDIVEMASLWQQSAANVHY